MKKLLIGVIIMTGLLSVSILVAAKIGVTKDSVRIFVNTELSEMELDRTVVKGESYFLLEDLKDLLGFDFSIQDNTLRLSTGVAHLQKPLSIHFNSDSTPSLISGLDIDSKLYVQLEDLATNLDFDVTYENDAIHVSSGATYRGYYDVGFYCEDYSSVPDLGNTIGLPPFQITIEGGYGRTTYVYAGRTFDETIKTAIAEVLAAEGFSPTNLVGAELDFNSDGGTDEFVFVKNNIYVSVASDPNADDASAAIIIRMATK